MTMTTSTASLQSLVNVNDPDVVASVIPQSTNANTYVENRNKRRLAKVHSLPCTIHNTTDHGQQAAAVGVYFQPVEMAASYETTQQQQQPQQQSSESNNSLLFSSSTWAAQFRGRGLVGRECRFPPHVSGLVISDGGFVTADEDQGGKRKKKFSIVASFQSITEWGHDEDPSKRASRSELVTNPTKVARALDWLELAATIHAPIQPSD